MDDDEAHGREVRLQERFPKFATSYTRLTESRVRWDTRVTGTDGDPAFSTSSWEEMELWLSRADPAEASR